MPFLNLEDTPMFRMKVAELDGGCKRLRERVTLLVGHYRRYRDALVALCKAQIEFAADQISAEWLDDLLVGARDSHRAYERSSADLEDAATRALALKKGAKRELLDRAAAELATARLVEQEARFDCARRLSAVESRRRYSFLQLLLDTAGAHHAALRSGSEMLGRLTPLGDAARGQVADARAAEAEVQAMLAQEAARCKAIGDAAAAAAASSSLAGDESGHGPVQMSGLK
ncbi:hypothetical protein GPECTOR_26g519 [Gonium pectorale]|uniref:BAR domain-containing protein n=1 Tax=Gonium pectorale TaxID=33097 RepID=A0A150GFL3_GONPE|nr:hypothetical protein GPECTOR_26g519 [Gonium pectorale]|eukprot:KXZ48616.1 hypothetical protein GPECTOR_26g519 [Gonium pectorale]